MQLYSVLYFPIYLKRPRYAITYWQTWQTWQYHNAKYIQLKYPKPTTYPFSFAICSSASEL